MSARRHCTERVFSAALKLAAVLVLLVVVAMVATLVWQGAPAITWEFVSQPPRDGMTAGGIFPALIGTVLLVALMMVLALPIGILAAVHLAEYLDGRLARLAQAAVNNLAAVPSIVFGLFGLGFFVLFLQLGASLLASALTLSLLVLPIVIVSTQEALLAVSRSHREASFALGATRWQMIRTVVLPQALPGILSGAVLAISRGAGEVAPIMFTGAAYFLPQLPHSPFDQFMSLGYHVYVMATQSVDVDQTAPLQWGTALVLLAVTIGFNLTAILVRARMQAR